ERFHGMFAFAIHDRESGRLVLARDRFGIKPLYLSEKNGRLRFASTLPALVAAGDVDTSIDRVALAYYMSFHAVVPPPRTLISGVKKLPPATIRVIEADGASSERRYWEAKFTRSPDDAGLTVKDWADRVLDKLRKAVARRMVA